MAEAEVEITGTTIVHKSSMKLSTTNHPHVLPLSHLDTDRNCHVTFRTLRVYVSSNANPDDPFSVITKAVSAALHHYHPVAGTLRRRAVDGRLELHCDSGSGKACRSRAPRAGGLWSRWVTWKNPVCRSRTGSFPTRFGAWSWGVEEGEHPLVVQVTRFACGGFALGICIHHSMVDGSGSTLFLSAVAEIARSSGSGDSPSVVPVWDRAVLLGPRKPSVVKVDCDKFLMSVNVVRSCSTRMGGPAGSNVESQGNAFTLTRHRFRARLVDVSGWSFTTFEALSAFVWRARVKVKKLASDARAKLVYSMNIRKILKPGLPTGYWGNVCVPVYVCMKAVELLERPMWETTMCIKNSKLAVTDEYVRSYLDVQELHYKEGIMAREEVSGSQTGGT